MKNFITCLTLFLLVNLAHGQNIAVGTFTNGDATLLIVDPGSIASATITAGDPASDCLATPSTPNTNARTLSPASSPQTITIVITPNAGYKVRVDAVEVTLKLSGSSGTATVTVGGTTPFGTAAVDNNCSTTVFAGTPVESMNPVTITIVVSGYTGNNRSLTFDDILIVGASPLLPVELSKFNVKKTEQSVMLSWATASEKNNDHFEIQKSTNGTQFETIGQAKGNGTTATGATYSFEDKNPSVGIAYYRLKQVDADGKFENSAVRSILFGKSKLTVFSTVAKEKISIVVSDDQTVPYDIINLNGQTVLAGKAIGQHTIDISGLHSGMYFIRTEGGEVTRFVKE